MKILSLSNCALVESQGSGYVALNFIRGLRALGHEVEAFGPEDFEPLTGWRLGRNFRLALGMAWCAFWKLLTKKYDVVEFYGGHAWFAVRYLARRRHRRFLLVQHTNGPEPRYEKMLDRHFGSDRRRWFQLSQATLMKRAFTCPDLVVTVSESDRSWLIDEGYQPPKQVIAIENPIADVFFEPHDPLRKEKIIGYCGTWLPKKGIHILAPDISRILQAFPEYRLLLIGVGNAFKPEEYFPEIAAARIEVIPHIENKVDLRRQYERMELFVFPSVIESFGLALAEAMACGCAVVATQVGFAASLRNRIDAMLLEKAESPQLYDAVKELIARPDLRQYLAANGHRRVAHLKWGPAVRKLSDVYEASRHGVEAASRHAN